MRAITVTRPGGPEVMELVTVEDPQPARGEVLIRVRATSVNRTDILQRMGRYPPPPGASEILGLEAAGTIEQVGDGVEGWSVGDRVMALLSGGGYAELVTTPQELLMPVPEGMDWILAAAIPEVYLTAWQAFTAGPRPGPGTHVLVHAGASGVGLACLDIAQNLGATTIATTRSPEKAEQLELLSDHVIVPGPDGFRDQVADITDGTGVELIIDVVGAAYWDDNVHSLAMDGHLALVGLLGGRRTEVNLAELLAKRATVRASTLRNRPLTEKAGLVSGFHAWAAQRFVDRSLRPRVHDIVPLQRAVDAHRLLETNQTTGKVVMIVSEDGLIER